MRFPKTLLSTVVLIVGSRIASGFADEREVNSIWWSLEDDEGSQSVCVAENYNEFPVDAVFKVFPAAFDADGDPMPSTAAITMRPYVEYKLYRWDNVAGPGPQCSLLTYSAPVH